MRPIIPSLIARDLFPLLTQQRKLHYLDSAATTQQPASVLAAQDQFIRSSYGPVHRSVYDLGATATAAYEGARDRLATFLGATTDEIIFTKSATEALNLAAWIEAPRLQPGDEILISVAEHHSNLLPWQRLASQRQAKLQWIELRAGELDLADFRAKLSSRTKIVAVTHLSNVLGVTTPLDDIVAAAHQVEARVVVDAAQSVSRLPLSVAPLDADYLAFSGHKMYGPTGIGVLYARKDVLEKAEPLHVGGGMVAEVTRHRARWLDGPARFEGGTPPVVPAIGLAAAVDFIDQVGLANIGQHEQQLTAYALKQLTTVPGIKIFGPRQVAARAGLLSWQMEVVGKIIHSHDIATIIGNAQVAIRAGHHCAQPLMEALGVTDLARASWGVYTSSDDIDALILALGQVYATFAVPAKKRATMPTP